MAKQDVGKKYKRALKYLGAKPSLKRGEAVRKIETRGLIADKQSYTGIDSYYIDISPAFAIIAVNGGLVFMLCIAEILEKTGLNQHTFNFWRRGGSNLLPKPVGVDKKVIFFDDSIVERIKFIRDRQAEGLSLAQIEELLHEELAEDAKTLPTLESLQADYEGFMEEIQDFTRQWEKGERRAEICAILKLDPVLSGQLSVFTVPALGKLAGTLMAYVAIVSNGVVHFAEICSDLYGETTLNQSAKIAADDYAMLLYVIGREFVSRKQLMKTEMIPYLLFHGIEGTGANSEFWLETLEVAPILNQITEASRLYLLGLRDKEFAITGTKKP